MKKIPVLIVLATIILATVAGCRSNVEDEIIVPECTFPYEKLDFALRNEAKTLSEELCVLLEKEASTTAMFQELFRMAQETNSRYTERMDAILDNPGTFILFPEIRLAFSRPTEGITPEQFDILARVFIKIADDVGATEEFLNLLANRVDVPNSVDTAYAAFTVCPEKVRQLQVRVDTEITLVLWTQFEYIRQGELSRSTVVTGLTDQRRKLMERSALLAVAVDLANSSTVSWGVDGHAVQRVLLADKDSLGPFSLQQNVGYYGRPPTRVPNGISLTVNHGTLARRAHGDADRIILEPLHSANFRGNNTVSISPNFSSTQNSAARVQSSISSVIDFRIKEVYFQTFGIHALFITEDGRPLESVVWVGVDSYVRLNAFNYVIDSGITWEQFLQDPNIALDLFRQAVPTYDPENMPESVRGQITEGGAWRLFDLNELDRAIRRIPLNHNSAPMLP